MESDSQIRIDQRDGTLYVDGRLDREVTPIIRLKVVARDGGIFEGEEVISIFIFIQSTVNSIIWNDPK